MKILIVEDDWDLAESYKGWLEIGKHQVLLAHTEVEAMTTLQQNPDIGLVFMDGSLDGTGAPDTMQLVANIRQRPTFKGRIIAISGSQHSNMILRQAGCHDSCEKGKILEKFRELGLG